MNKGFIGNLAERWLKPDLSKLKTVIREQLLSGVSEVEILGGIVTYAQNDLGRKLTDEEFDLFRQTLLNEKIALRGKGFGKSDFNIFWKASNAKLTPKQLNRAKKIVSELDDKHRKKDTIVEALQNKPSLEPKLGEKWRAERVVRTELKRDETKSIVENASVLGFSKYRVMLSPNACEVCRKATEDGNKIFTEDEINKGGKSVVPFHPNCVTGDTVVFSPDIQRVIRAHYSGNLIKITFTDGRSLSVTPNHVVLTPIGFASVDRLSKGDKIINSPLLKRLPSGDPDNNENITTISDLFESVFKPLESTTSTVPVSSEYLHGDARFCDGTIDIVSSESLLRHTMESLLFYHFYKPFLEWGGTPNLFKSLRNFNSMLIGLALTSDGIVSGMGISSIFGFSSSTMDELKGLLDVSNYNTRLQKAIMYNNSTDSILFSDSLLTHSPFIGFDEIVDIKVEPFHGDVYDISSSSTLYIANGVVSSNCYCLAIPYE